MLDMKELLHALSRATHPAGEQCALDRIEEAFHGVAATERMGNSLIATLPGKRDYTILLDAHVDEIGLIVTAVHGGFVKVASCGGVDLRTLPASEVVIHGRQAVRGVFATLPPHLKSGEDTLPELADMVIDTGFDSLEGIVTAGDRVSFCVQPRALLGERMTGKSLDDRAGVAALIYAAQKLCGQELPCTVKLLFSDQEELGCLGAQTAAFALAPDEAVAVDVSFGDGPDVSADKCGRLGAGPMIGVSPVLHARVTERLFQTADDRKIAYQIEAMGGRTSTNADVIALSQSGVACGLVSIPLRSMHTAAEVIDLADVRSVGELLYHYVMGGGICD